MTAHDYVLDRIHGGVYKYNTQLLKTDILLTYGYLNRLESEQMYNIAWKFGAEKGYEGVLDLFHDLVKLMERRVVN